MGDETFSETHGFLESNTSIQLIYLLLRFQQKTKFESKVMVSMAISAKNVSCLFSHRSKQVQDQTIHVSIDHLLTNIIRTEIFYSSLILHDYIIMIRIFHYVSRVDNHSNMSYRGYLDNT